MELRDADIVLVGLLIAVGLALAGYALGSAAAEAVGGESPGAPSWSSLSPLRWISWGQGSVSPPTPDAAGDSVESG